MNALTRHAHRQGWPEDELRACRDWVETQATTKGLAAEQLQRAAEVRRTIRPIGSVSSTLHALDVAEILLRVRYARSLRLRVAYDSLRYVWPTGSRS